VDGGLTLATAGVVNLVIGWHKSVAEEKKAQADAPKAETKHRLFCCKSIEQDSAFTYKGDRVGKSHRCNSASFLSCLGNG
jgi:hypothetical protein